MSRRTNRLSGQLSVFAQKYKRKAQRGAEPNDRRYSHEAEELMKRLSPEDLSDLLNSDVDQVLPKIRPKKPEVLPKIEAPRRRL